MIDWELDNNKIKIVLTEKLAKYFVNKGKKYVEQNFYSIQFFIQAIIYSQFIDTVKNVREKYLIQNPSENSSILDNLDVCFNIISYKKCLSSTASPLSFLPVVIFFIRSNGDIVKTFKKYFHLRIFKKKYQKLLMPQNITVKLLVAISMG